MNLNHFPALVAMNDQGRRLAAVVALLAALSAASLACTSTAPDAHSVSNRLCTPGANVFCNCIGGKESGTKVCAPSGMEFGGCEPCLGLPEGDTEPRRTEPDASTNTPDTVVSADQGDKCPGIANELSSSEPLTLYGNTAALKSNYAGSGACAKSGSAKDAVHALTAAERGRVTLTLKPAAGFDGTMYVKRGNCETGQQAACAEATAAGADEVLKIAVNAGETIYVVVDGKDTAAGAYTLIAMQEAGTFCGDGLPDPGELCDDGNEVAGDGCSAACLPELKSPLAKACPGQELHVWSDPAEFTGSTATFANANKSTCGGSGARDAVYAVVAHRAGTLHVSTKEAAFDVVMYARAAPCATGKELACASAFKGDGGEKMAITVAVDETVYVFVDGFKTSAGEYTLLLSID